MNSRREKKKFQVFVSSTYLDLKTERKTIIQDLIRMNCNPVGMELFPNGRPDVWDHIKSVINGSDFYVLVVAGRYGTETESGESYTEKEYQYALKQGKTILTFIHKNPAEHNAEFNQESKHCKKKLLNFREELAKRTCSYWGTLEELSKELAIELTLGIQKLLLNSESGEMQGQANALDILSDEISSLENRLNSPEIKRLTETVETILSGLQSGTTTGRLRFLGETLPWLDKKQWSFLAEIAHTLASVRSGSSSRYSKEDPVFEPLKQSADYLFNQLIGLLKNLQQGTIAVSGDSIYAVSGFFIRAIQKSFYGMSHDDFDFWNSGESKEYYEHNLDLVRRRRYVERTFVVPREKYANKDVHSAIRTQVSDGIKVRIISQQEIESIIKIRHHQDFGLHDDFAVSLFRNSLGREFRVETNPQQRDYFNKLYERVARYCEQVPGKDEPNSRLFESVDELDRWVETQKPKIVQRIQGPVSTYKRARR